MSWISIDDMVGTIQHALEKNSLSGPVNAVSPHPVTNLEFTKTLGRVLSRPTIFPVPAFAVRLMFGEMGEDLLLASARVEPARLAGSGYRIPLSGAGRRPAARAGEIRQPPGREETGRKKSGRRRNDNLFVRVACGYGLAVQEYV